MTKSTVFLAADDHVLRGSILQILQPKGIVVETCSASGLLLTTCELSRPGCLVLDMHLRNTDALYFYRDLVESGWRLPFIVITEHGKVSDATMAMRQGAINVLEKPIVPKELLTCVWEAFEEDAKRRREWAKQNAAQRRLDSLTPRERKVLEMVVAGLLTKQIAQELDISIKTVEAHRGKIKKKMKVKSVVELVRIITELRLFSQMTAGSLVDLSHEHDSCPGHVPLTLETPHVLS